MAAVEYQPGFRTIGNWSIEPELRLDLNIWYPTLRQARELSFSPWLVRGALNARPAEGKFPLIVISHSTAGSRFSYHDLGADLARLGFVVAAPTHGRDSMHNMDDLFSWRQFSGRAREISETIDLALSEKDLAGVIDRERIGFIGFGSGATTGILLGGAIPNCGSWKNYCENAGPRDAYCNPWARERISALCKNLPEGQSLANGRLKAIVAVAPGFGMLFDSESFINFKPPLLLIAAGRDAFNPPRLHCERIARFLGKKARYLDLANADTGALMSACPPPYEAELPELCNSVGQEERKALHARLLSAVAAFFSHYLAYPAAHSQKGEPEGVSSPEMAAAQARK